MILFNGEPKEVLPARCDVLLPVEIWTFSGDRADPRRPSPSSSSRRAARRGGPTGSGPPPTASRPALARSAGADPGSAGARRSPPSPSSARAARTSPRGSARRSTGTGWRPRSTSSPTRARSGSRPSPPTRPTCPRAPRPSRRGSTSPSPAASAAARWCRGWSRCRATPCGPEKLAGAPEALLQLPGGRRGAATRTSSSSTSATASPCRRARSHGAGDPRRLPAQPAAGGLLADPQDRGHGGASATSASSARSRCRRSMRRQRPQPPWPPRPPRPPVPDAAPRSTVATQAALAEANAALGSGDQTIRILPPPAGAGHRQAARRGHRPPAPGVARVSFELDGKPVLTKGRPPYSVELNLGVQPRTHLLRALALDAGRATASPRTSCRSTSAPTASPCG